MDLAAAAFPTPRARTIVKGLLKLEAMKDLGLCQMRSETEHPCPRPAVMVFWGLPFCERCAREQESYFAIGELTQEEEAHSLRNEPLVETLGRMRWERTAYTAAAEMEKAKVTVGAPE